MKNLDDLRNLIDVSAENINIPFVLINLLACFIASFILRKFYISYSSSLVGKNQIGSIIPILSSVVFLVIVIVKSSLALSLGLVGALSIVRFRTPIKEPEELVYLFLSIATGLGYGSGYSLITSTILALTLSVIYFFLRKEKVVSASDYNLIIDHNDVNFNFEKILFDLSHVCNTIKIIRVDKSKNNQTLVLLITLKENSKFEEINKILGNDEFKITFFEAKTNW